MQIDRAEISRYLGYGRRVPDPAVSRKIEEAVALLEQKAAPHALWAAYPVSIADATVKLGPLSVQSAALSRHLRGCVQACLFAATLGPAPDRLQQKAEVQNMALALTLQATAAAMIEAYCDEEAERLAAHFAPKKLYLRPRFSPGYGDFPLSFQPVLLRALDAPKRIGLTCTQSCLLAPTKSVTAVIGLSAAPASAQTACAGKCASCENKTCPYRLS